MALNVVLFDIAVLDQGTQSQYEKALLAKYRDGDV